MSGDEIRWAVRQAFQIVKETAQAKSGITPVIALDFTTEQVLDEADKLLAYVQERCAEDSGSYFVTTTTDDLPETN